MLDPEKSLVDQNVKNFQQILALVLETTETDALTEANSYDRIKKIRSEAELLLNNKQSDFFHVIKRHLHFYLTSIELNLILIIYF